MQVQIIDMILTHVMSSNRIFFAPSTLVRNQLIQYRGFYQELPEEQMDIDQITFLHFW